MRRLLLLGALCSACSGSGTAPTPTPIPTPVPPTVYALSGTVTATNGRQALPGITAVISSLTAVTDTAGQFSGTLTNSGSLPLALSGSGIVPRSIMVAVNGSRSVTVDAFTIGASFDLGYYRKLVRNGYDTPTFLLPLRRLTAAPRVYLRTMDDVGLPIDATTLNVTENTILSTGGAFTGERFGIAGVERGTETRDGASGWLTVHWPNPGVASQCGNSSVGVDGGTINLNYLNTRCACGGSHMEPATVRHELGHAFGLWHTGDGADAMSGFGNTSGSCDFLPTARERLYAGYLYSRPIGNIDPDTDGFGTVNLAPMRVP